MSAFNKSRFQAVLDEWTQKGQEIRIVMVGKAGAGKSASANTILGKKVFNSRFSSKSGTALCVKASDTVDGQKVSIIDTPGLLDTMKGEEETTYRNVIQCMAYASPGPHVFLVVIRLAFSMENEKETVQQIQQIFGEGADKYTMVLFTHRDSIGKEPFEKFLQERKELRELVAKCNDQYHVFDNNLKDRSQVTELLSKIRNITEKNGGSHYTNEMFQKTENSERAQLNQEKAQLNQEKAQLNQEKAQLNQQIKRLIHQGREQFQQEINQINLEIKQLINQGREQFQQETNQINQEINQLNDKIIQLHEAKAPLNQAQVQLYQARVKLYQVRAKLNQTSAKLINQEKAQLNQEKAQLNQEKAQLNQEKAQLNQQIKRLNQERAQLKEKIKQLKEEIERLNQERCTVF